MTELSPPNRDTAGDVPGVRPTIRDIHRAIDMLQAAGDPALRRVAHALDACLRGDNAIVALGLRGAAGRRSPASQDRDATRDRLLREMAAKHYAGESVAEQSRRILADWNAYTRNRRAGDEKLEYMPASYEKITRGFLFRIVRLPHSVPGDRRLREILSNGSSS